MQLNKIWIIRDVVDPSTWEEHCTDLNVCEFLCQQFASFPENARLYHESISEETDVTPCTEKDIEDLLKLDGEFFIVTYHAATGLAIAAIIIAVLAVAAAFFLQPNVDTNTSSDNKKSSNNQLSDRSNEQRIGERVPYIVGQVRAYPDFASQPYKTYEGGQEVEHATFCIGQGYYEVQDAYEDETLFTEIAGNALQVYDPGVDVVTGSPSTQMGEEFSEPLYVTKKSSTVNNITMNPADVSVFTPGGGLAFGAPNQIFPGAPENEDFTAENIYDGDTINLANAVVLYSGETIDLSGQYVVASVTTDAITLDSPRLVNANWAKLSASVGNTTAVHGASVGAVYALRWNGPFQLNLADRSSLIANFRCPSGCYRISFESPEQFAETVNFELRVHQLVGNVESETYELYTGGITGSSSSRDAIGKSLIIETGFTGPCAVYVRRTTVKEPNDDRDSYVNTINISELYAAVRYDSYIYNDVSIVRTKTYATAAAVNVSDRKLNTLVTRKFPARSGDNGFTTELYPTLNAADILCAIALEPTIGNRSVAELDIPQIYDTVAQVEDYFGFSAAAQFCYTFSDADISFEEAVTSLAQAIFCQAYRRGSKIKLFFERQTDDSVLLFNHRNKVPGSETRTVTFGEFNDYDGVEVNYNDPDDFDSTQTIYIPADQSAVNPKKLDYIGIRNANQATLLAWRAWQKIKYQNVSCEFTATDEANLLLLNERILNADNTRTGTQDGEIISVTGLEVFCSQPVELLDGQSYNLFLQLYDGTVQSIPVTKGTTSRSLLLSIAPRLPLVTDRSYYAVTTYQLVGSAHVAPRAFLTNELTPNTDYTVKTVAKNYDDRFYSHDFDYK